MATKTNSGKITLANFIAVVGLVILLAFTYLGQSYLSGGEIGLDIIISVVITGVFAFLLFMMIKAKSAENGLSKWKVVEYVSLGLYVVCIILSLFFSGIMHFFVVNEKKEQIKQYAKSDIELVEQNFEDYKTFVTNAINLSKLGIQNARGQACDTELQRWLADGHNDDNTYENTQKTLLLTSGLDNLKNEYEQKKAAYNAAVDNWNVLTIASQSRTVIELDESSTEELKKLLEKGDLPIIDKEDVYKIKGNQKDNLQLQSHSDQFMFRKALSETKGFSVIALVIVLLIHAVILFNYLVAHRTTTLEIRAKVVDGGTQL